MKKLPLFIGFGIVVAIAMSPTAQTTIANNAAEMSGRIVMLADGTIARTITNLFTFNRGASAPFAVQSGAAKVSNLNADQVDGYEGINLLDIGNCQFRLTLTTNTPVTTADVLAAVTVFVTPVEGYQCAVYDGSASWLARTSTELSFSIAGFAANTNFDVWLYDNAGTLATETLAWSGDTTRATALTTQNGVLVKTGATTRRFVGTFRTTAVIGQTEDSAAKRFVFSQYHRARREMRVLEATNSWPYTTATTRQANGSTANQLAFVSNGDGAVSAEVQVAADNATPTQAFVFIGEDSTTTPSTSALGGRFDMVVASSQSWGRASLAKTPTAGYHFWVWQERSAAVGGTTWYGDNGGLLQQSGITGVIFD
jgi:hypothetical protein